MTDSLLTKYRPASFDEVIGHDAVIRSLMSVLAAGSSRAFLFSGPSGVGKTTIARICASMLGARDSLALVEIDAATYTGINNVRAITDTLRFKPFAPSNVKVLIIDECHALSTPAWQAMLKALEEPPPWAYWFLCTTNGTAVPETANTRCAVYTLRQVPAREIAGLLAQIAAKEKMTVPDDIIGICAREAHGSVRKAIANLVACAEIGDPNEARALLRSSRAVDMVGTPVEGGRRAAGPGNSFYAAVGRWRCAILSARGLSAADKCVAIALLECVDGGHYDETGELVARASQAELARILGRHKVRIRATLDRLLANSVVTIEREGGRSGRHATRYAFDEAWLARHRDVRR
jgi:DNA polymerase III delta prime subunit